MQFGAINLFKPFVVVVEKLFCSVGGSKRFSPKRKRRNKGSAQVFFNEMGLLSASFSYLLRHSSSCVKDFSSQYNPPIEIVPISLFLSCVDMQLENISRVLCGFSIQALIFEINFMVDTTRTMYKQASAS